MEEEITIDTLKLTAEGVKKQATDDTKLRRIPPKLYQANPEAFTPQLVSIGPFHHLGHNFNRFKDVNILAMEGKKRVYMLNLLRKYTGVEETDVEEAGIEEEKLEYCKKFLNEKSRDIWDCYAEEIDMSEELLVKIMLVDGCFILGLFFAMSFSDEIDYVAGRYPRDLALLENQIPFFVLEGLLHFIRPDLTVQYDLTDMLLRYFRLTPEPPPLPPHTRDFKHLLDLISKCHRPDPTTIVRRGRRNYLRYPSKGIHLMNATKLSDAGVTFRSTSGKRLLDVDFSNGVFKFPPLVIHKCTETILMNLLAYEHLSPYQREYFTSYVVLMSHLVTSQEDFQLLEKQGIFVNEMGSREDASKIFINISKQFVIKEFYYKYFSRRVEEYVNSRWQRYIQDLKRRCFKSPWTIVSVIAATVLLILTTVQTIFSVLSYYQPKLS